MREKLASASVIIMNQVMLPSQANANGNIHGGELMKLMDSAAYVVARRHAQSNVVTARVDELEFHLPIFVGELVTCTAQIVFAGKSSMEVAVTVEVEDMDSDEGPKKAQTAFFTMVALDKKSRPNEVPKLITTTQEEKDRFEEGRKRYESYKAKKVKA